ncbi:hypothetical protein OF83DRAFT_1103972 [Amylostereum chailletii]|nr:hypothetical protein OF83DRAFT_1103972 [Amylostereum chailletii]
MDSIQYLGQLRKFYQIQRTPIVNRSGGSFAPQAQVWGGTRQQFAMTSNNPPKTHTASERSNSAQEVEDLLNMPNRTPRTQRQQSTGWLRPQSYRPSQRVFAPSVSRRAPGGSGFRPVNMTPR